MSNLSEYGVKVDVELFDLIALAYKYRVNNYRKPFLDRAAKFILNTDHISGCLFIQAMPCELISKLIEVDKQDKILIYIGKFIKVHSVPKINKMLAARYGDELRRLELRMGTDYSRIVEIFAGE